MRKYHILTGRHLASQTETQLQFPVGQDSVFVMRISLSLITATRVLNQLIICWCQRWPKQLICFPDWPFSQLTCSHFRLFHASLVKQPMWKLIMSGLRRSLSFHIYKWLFFPSFILFLAQFAISLAAGPEQIHAGAKIHNPNSTLLCRYNKSIVVMFFCITLGAFCPLLGTNLYI